MKNIIKAVLSLINRIPAVSPALDKVCMYFHRLHENHNYEHDSNGERWLMDALAKKGKLDLCFDVGANRGDWVSLVLERNPSAKIHCFEACPPTYAKLANRLSGDDRVILNNIGLSDQFGKIQMNYCAEQDGLSSMFEVICSKNVETVSAEMIPAANYCIDNAISHIDFLKVDVEGADYLVMKGFADLLKPESIKLVQFEYGLVSIVTKFMLKDFHEYFESRGYVVGKLFPDHVRFRKYRFEDEDFLGPNYIAAAPELVPLLQGN